jgi:hypothetical protein
MEKKVKMNKFDKWFLDEMFAVLDGFGSADPIELGMSKAKLISRFSVYKQLIEKPRKSTPSKKEIEKLMAKDMYLQDMGKLKIANDEHDELKKKVLGL